MSDPHAEGWAFCLNWRKAHYVRNARSLCGKWMYLGGLFEQDNSRSPDDCTTCRRLKDKETTNDRITTSTAIGAS